MTPAELGLIQAWLSTGGDISTILIAGFLFRHHNRLTSLETLVGHLLKK